MDKQVANLENKMCLLLELKFSGCYLLDCLYSHEAKHVDLEPDQKKYCPSNLMKLLRPYGILKTK